jgi:hypothetical protein
VVACFRSPLDKKKFIKLSLKRSKKEGIKDQITGSSKLQRNFMVKMSFKWLANALTFILKVVKFENFYLCSS